MLNFLKLLLYLSLAPAFGQVNPLKTLEARYSLDLRRESFPELHFDWNFDGYVQASVNAGLTELLENKDYNQASVYFDEAIVKSASCLPALYYRGICYKILDKLPQAKDDLSKAATLAPDRTEILIELAEVYELQRDYPAAEKLYEKAIALDRACATAYFNMANLSLRQGLLPRAKRYFKQSLKADPTYFKSHVRRGLVSYGVTGKVAAGIKHLDKALALDSASDAALFWRGMLYLRNRDFEKSLEDWSKLARQNPEDPTFILLRASLYLELMDYERAFIDLKDIFAKNYNDENRFRGTQSTTDRSLDLQFAISYITRTIYGLTDEASSHLKKGFCLMVLGHREDASEELKRSFKLQPSALSLFLTAVNYEHSEKHDSAFHYYDAALKLDNDIFDAHKKRAIYFSELKNWKTAYQHFENMIRLEPQLKLTYRLRSMVRIDFKDYYGAIMDLTRYLRIDSADHEVYVYRAQCKIAVEDYKGANQDYRKAVKVRPDKSDLYDLVVTSDLQLGDTTHALETITQYEGKFGVSSLLFSKKIRIYIDQNRIADARSEFMKVAGDKFWLSMQGDKAQSLIYFLEGWLDYLQNDEERALRNLGKALSLDQENFEAKYLRGKLYLSRGDRTKALNDLKTLAQAGYLNADALLKELE